MSVASQDMECADPLSRVDLLRLDAARRLKRSHRGEFGQFFTPAPVAQLIASFAAPTCEDIRLLDPGAGVGSLTMALVADLVGRRSRPRSISVTAYEVEPLLVDYLRETMDACKSACEQADVAFRAEVVEGNFIAAAVEQLKDQPLWTSARQAFNCAILNPPYSKINSNSVTRRALRSVGIETSNLYTAFLWLAARMLETHGEIIAITPRSFCNGPYFRPFRRAFLHEFSLRRVHVFGSRKSAFRDDSVLQENIIFRAKKSPNDSGPTVISSSHDIDDQDVTILEVSPTRLVHADDQDKVIHLGLDGLDELVRQHIDDFEATLPDLDLEVSTGRVVDFRSRPFLSGNASRNSVPLIFPEHCRSGGVDWPRKGKKPDYIADDPATQELLVPTGNYVLVKRFSAKEERRRVSAAICRNDCLPGRSLAFENHLNYFHRRGGGLPIDLAKGLTAYLNSTLVDAYFRQFSGHTQINAADLRALKYPAAQALERVGRRIGDSFPQQDELDEIVSEEFLKMAGKQIDPVKAKKRLEQALAVLQELGLPRAQQNERSALALLSLLDMKPATPWSKASSPLRGITPMMEFFAEFYGRRYAPNTRETVRRQTVHQFIEAGILVPNPDDPRRPINSGKTVYQIESGALELLRQYGRQEWDNALRTWLTSVETLKRKYARERQMQRIPLRLSTGERIDLSPGGQNVLVERIIDEFCPRFTPNGKPIYVGDTDAKWAYFDKATLAELGVSVDEHGKMPDVVVHHRDRNWLVLIEAVTSHGPVDGKRRDELTRLFSGCSAGLVFVTAFLTRAAMVRYLSEISWETEVWVADAPSHLIHFNGERFLGPYARDR